MIFEKLLVAVDSSNVEVCHWLPGNRNKSFITKISKRKDINRIRRVKKKLKGIMNLSSIGITTPVHLNDSPCSCYKCCGENVKNFGQVSLYTRSGCPMDLLKWRQLITTEYIL